MSEPKSVTKSVTQTSDFYWKAHHFNVRWVEHPRDVPEYDVSRYPEVLNLLAHDQELSKGDWQRERALMTDDVRAKIVTAPQSGYPRLVVSLNSQTMPQQNSTSHDFLKDLKALYRMSIAPDPSHPKSAFRKGVLDLAERYTPFASLNRFDNSWHGLTLEAWLDLVTRVHVYDKLLGEINAVADARGGVGHVKEWVEQQSQAAKKNIYLARWWKHLKNAYFDYVDTIDLVSQKVRRNPNVPVLKSYKQLRNNIARDLHNRMTGGYRFSLVSTPTDTFDNRYRIACEVGVSEWADFLLSQKFPTAGHTKICEVCGKTFSARKRDSRLCSSRCRTAKHRRAKK
jgi:hypothetical protein